MLYPTKERQMTLVPLPIKSMGDLSFHSPSSLAATDCSARYLAFVIELADKFSVCLTLWASLCADSKLKTLDLIIKTA